MRIKFLASLLLAAASSSVFAMPSDPVKHTGVLEVALTGGGFTVGTQDTAYGLYTNNLELLSQPIGEVLKIDPKFKFGGSVLVGYFFPCSSINVDASYFGTRNRVTQNDQGLISINLGLPGWVGEEGNNTASAAYTTYHYNYDLANIELGSLTRIDSNGLIINPKAGLSYAQLKSNQYVKYTGEGVDLSFAAGQFPGNEYSHELNSRFTGFGPSIGFDLNYTVCNPFHLISSFRYNALVGNILFNYFANETANTSGNDPIPEYDISSKTRKMLVSLIQAELGISYDFDWINAFCGNLAVGYQLSKAFDSGEKLSLPDNVTNNQHGYFIQSITNANIHGWFLRLTMDFPI